MQLKDGPFKELHGRWQFHALGRVGVQGAR
jgi:ribosome-associated toxin RatA of RatAB toxin-antitoxin module